MARGLAKLKAQLLVVADKTKGSIMWPVHTGARFEIAPHLVIAVCDCLICLYHPNFYHRCRRCRKVVEPLIAYQDILMAALRIGGHEALRETATNIYCELPP